MSSYNELSSKRQVYIEAIVKHGGDLGIDVTKTQYNRTELRSISMAYKGKKWIPNWITHDKDRRAGVGVFFIPEVQDYYGLHVWFEPETDEGVDFDSAVETADVAGV